MTDVSGVKLQKITMLDEREQAQNDDVTKEKEHLAPAQDTQEATKPINPVAFKRKSNILQRCVRWCFQRLIVESCFPVSRLASNKLLVFALYAICIWLVLYVVSDSNALPGSFCFSLFVMVISAHVFGFCFEIVHLSSLLGI